MFEDRVIDATEDEVESAKQSIVKLMDSNGTRLAEDLFFTNSLDEIEAGIKKLNDMSSRSWLLSAILLHTLIYSRQMYLESGLDWKHYIVRAKKNMGLCKREISEQLSAARFFIKYHERLERKGFNFIGANSKLARCEQALKLCGNVDVVIKHLVEDGFREFRLWYQSLKAPKELESTEETLRSDFKVDGDRFFIRDVEAVSISEELPESDRVRMTEYVRQIFEILEEGDEPAIISVYSKKEGALLKRLRDRNRENR